MRLLALLAACSATLCFVSGCESDALGPTSQYEGSECLKTGQCGDDKLMLDAGAGVVLDSGALPGVDSGDTTGAPDAGDTTAADSGDTTSPDSGNATPPDSGVVTPPPSAFLDLNGTWNTRYEFDLSAYLF